MTRTFIKGGPWKNTEDEILKAAVMKYGKNQWARIASLLNRKSAKQCKARWYEWLDPSIKKTEWTREEEEKLLHLAKIMPTQWRTIAPIVGRTASQCLEHYERLLDQAQERDKDYDATEDPRRLKPGEIDPNPEAKPARPDAIDMDEDEKEMLSEARARLANTKGKKAKRKAREKQLQEARRLTALQKRREMKAAGIHLPPSRYRTEPTTKKKQVETLNYNVEIPFEKKPAPGFFDTTAEKLATKELEFVSKTLQALEGGREEEEEQRLRKKDKERQKKKEQTNLPEAIMQINRLNDPEFVQKRTQLVLPPPQVSDAELEEIGKMGLQATTVLSLAYGEGSSSSATNSLLSDYRSATPAVGSSSSIRSARTPAKQDIVLLEAQNLIALTAQQTPLIGGENVSLNSQFKDFRGSTPSKNVSATPNPLATPMTVGGKPTLVATSGTKIGATPTPMRDQLHINELTPSLEANSTYTERQRQEYLKTQIRSSLKNLPAPSTDQFVALRTSQYEDEEEMDQSSDLYEEDAGEMRKRKQERKLAKEQIRFKKQSQVVQRELPRPTQINEESESYVMDTSEDQHSCVKELIAREMLALIRYDAAIHPYGSNGGKRSKFNVTLEDVKLAQIQKAREELQNEMYKMSKNVPQHLFEKVWIECVDQIFGNRMTLTEDQIAQERSKVQKLSSRLQILTGGYSLRSQGLQTQINNLDNEISTAMRDLESYRALYDLEGHAAPKRLTSIEESIKVQKDRERQLQDQYRKLMQEKERMQTLLRIV